jgi:hypothetical protein
MPGIVTARVSSVQPVLGVDRQSACLALPLCIFWTLASKSFNALKHAGNVPVIFSSEQPAEGSASNLETLRHFGDAEAIFQHKIRNPLQSFVSGRVNSPGGAKSGPAFLKECWIS